MNDHPMMPARQPDGQANWIDGYMLESPSGRYQPQAQLINANAIRGILFRQRWLIAGVIVAAVLAGLIITLLSTPMYEARSSVRIEPHGSFIVEGQNVDQGISSNQVYDLLSTQVGVITSRSLANTVAQDQNLGERNDFLGEEIDESRPPNISDEAWLESKEQMAAARLHGAVSAEFPDNNWIIQIAYRSESPAIAAEMANAYSAAFAASDTRNSLANNEYAQDYLREQIELTRQRLQTAEQAANSYARANGIIMQPVGGEEDGGNVTLTTANLASINQRVSNARAARIEAEQRWRAVRDLPAGQLTEVQQNSLLQNLLSDRTTRQTELTAMRQRYNDDFPQIIDLRAQIATLDAEIERSMANIKAAVRNEFTVAQNQEQALVEELNLVAGATLVEQDRQVEFSVLEREAQALRDQLQALLTRFNQVSTATNIQTGLINPLDSAAVPTSPYAPSLLRNMVLALVFGIAFGGGLAVLRESLDDRIRSIDDIEERLGMPIFGHTPNVDEQDIEYSTSDRYSALMEAYASIRASMDFSLPHEQNVIQLTSSQESEGKSTTAVILAELFAGLGRKVLLIDADLRRPSIASLLDLRRPKVGLVEVLLGQADLQDTVIRGVHENLEILPVGAVPANPTEVLASSQLRAFIEKYRNEYSLIIFDSAPVLGLADAPMLSRLVDGTVFVMEANRVRFSQARSALGRLRSNGGNPIGGILTKYRAQDAGEDYNYHYNYYQYGGDKKLP